MAKVQRRGNEIQPQFPADDFFALVSGVVWGIAGYISYKETRESIDEFFDTYQMALGRQLAAADWSGVSLKTQKATDKLIKGIENADDDDDAVGFAIFSPQGEMIFTTTKTANILPRRKQPEALPTNG